MLRLFCGHPPFAINPVPEFTGACGFLACNPKTEALEPRGSESPHTTVTLILPCSVGSISRGYSDWEAAIALTLSPDNTAVSYLEASLKLSVFITHRS